MTAYSLSFSHRFFMKISIFFLPCIGVLIDELNNFKIKKFKQIKALKAIKNSLIQYKRKVFCTKQLAEGF